MGPKTGFSREVKEKGGRKGGEVDMEVIKLVVEIVMKGGKTRERKAKKKGDMRENYEEKVRENKNRVKER